jgi:hypothetical protein
MGVTLYDAVTKQWLCIRMSSSLLYNSENMFREAKRDFSQFAAGPCEFEAMNARVRALVLAASNIGR